MEPFEHRLSKALSEWVKQIGESHVFSGGDSLEQQSRCTLPEKFRPAAVLFPSSVSDVQNILKTAGPLKIPVYPLSQGKNWGYGCATPSQNQTVVLNLSRMNKILEVNEKLGYAVVEPGVTPDDLYTYLENKNIPLCLDVTGGPRTSSLIGNALERGYGQTPYSDHFLHSCGMEVILGDGRVLNTGFGRFEGVKTQYLYRWGVGPTLDGLFTQSNFGVVSKLGIWLLPKPEYFGVFNFNMKTHESLAQAVEKIRELKMRGVLVSAVHIFNDIRAVSSIQQYPWDQTNGKTPLPENIRKKLRSQYDLHLWNCAGGLRGSKAHVKAVVKDLRSALKGISRVLFVSEKQVKMLSPLIPLVEKLTGKNLRQKIGFLKLMKGIPTDQPLMGAYWRKRTKAPDKNMDPAKDGCGLLWCAPVIPAQGEDVLLVNQITEKTCQKYGFEPNISFSHITDRAISCVIGILFDLENKKESELAETCRQDLLTVFKSKGYMPYRFGSQPLPKDMTDPSVFLDVCKGMKGIFDPDRIISPGHYGIY